MLLAAGIDIMIPEDPHLDSQEERVLVWVKRHLPPEVSVLMDARRAICHDCGRFISCDGIRVECVGKGTVWLTIGGKECPLQKW